MLHCTLKRLDDTEKVVSWKCKGLLAEKILLIIVFLHQLAGMEIQIFVHHLKEAV